jgi:hypothetical protein
MSLKNFSEWLVEAKSGELLKPKRGVIVDFDHKKYPELADEFFDLIQTAYAEVGGHSKVLTPDDVFKDPEWNYWAGEDIHGTPDFDMVIFGSKTRFGIKFAGVGHDGSRDAKKEYMEQRGRDLKKLGYYVEVSGKIAEILIKKYDVPVVNDQQTVEKVLGKKVNWYGKNPDDPNSAGDGWYGRVIGGHVHNKIMLGKPKA